MRTFRRVSQNITCMKILENLSYGSIHCSGLASIEIRLLQSILKATSDVKKLNRVSWNAQPPGNVFQTSRYHSNTLLSRERFTNRDLEGQNFKFKDFLYIMKTIYTFWSKERCIHIARFITCSIIIFKYPSAKFRNASEHLQKIKHFLLELVLVSNS